ncbi:Zinc finger CCCH domain-containing protein [Arachis hypogaea]|uniref:Zinc finger CCCH domain-containing protein n=1 Tax=Arachis hypogaea TaxID=3818 RepID=A0A6B9V912_ARAHY|nr:Zinc finger CCCH domain-containing protein [Arachis hypogaea]
MCHFSHDSVPSTKSKPCSFFACHSCMKGDDCPFDHQLFKYPCVSFVFGGSYQPKEDFATPSRVHNLGMKSPHFSGNTNSNMPPNIHGCSSIQQNHLIIPPRVHSDINSEHKATNTVQKQLKLASKGVSSVDVAKLLLPSPTTPKEGTTKVGSSSSDQNPVCSFKSSINSLVNGENSIDLLQNISFSLLDHTSSTLKDATKGRVPQTDLVSSEISGSSHVDNNVSKPVQEARGASDSCQIPAAIWLPFMRLVSPSSSEQLPSRKELLSTVLSFAAEHESVQLHDERFCWHFNCIIG